MRSLWLSYKIGFCKNKQTESAQNQRSEGASMDPRWTRRRGNQAQGREKTNIFRFKLFLYRGINTVHEFLCTRNAVCVDVTYTVLTVRAICEGLFVSFLPVFSFSAIQHP